jgi:hypothetical protein
MTTVHYTCIGSGRNGFIMRNGENVATTDNWQLYISGEHIGEIDNMAEAIKLTRERMEGLDNEKHRI